MYDKNTPLMIIESIKIIMTLPALVTILNVVLKTLLSISGLFFIKSSIFVEASCKIVKTLEPISGQFFIFSGPGGILNCPCW